MSPEVLVSYATIIASVILSFAFLLTVYRILVGPTLPDRVIALDMLVGIVIGFIAVIAIRTSVNLYIDLAIALALVGFLATVAFARFILSRSQKSDRNAGAKIDGFEVGFVPDHVKNEISVASTKRKKNARKRRG